MKLAKVGLGYIFFSEFQLNLLFCHLSSKASPHTTYAQMKNQVGKRCEPDTMCLYMCILMHKRLEMEAEPIHTVCRPGHTGLSWPQGNG